MPVPNAASVTYLVGPRRGRPLKCHRRDSLPIPPADDLPWTPPASWKRKTPLVLPVPTAPYRTVAEIHAAIRAANPDAPRESWHEARDIIQRHAGRPLFRDS